MSEQNQRAEELFETLNKNKKMRKRKLIRNVVILIAVIAVILVVAVIMLRRNVDQRFASAAADVLSYEVSTGTINTTVSGSGVLTEVDQEQITVPSGVEINEVMVDPGDTVKQGDLLATVDMATVMTALSALQEEMDDLDDDINDAKGETVSSTIYAGITGRVKQIFAEKDMDVSACMAKNGALAVLSLDGYMALDLETEQLSKGDTVSVTRADGITVIEGTVESAAGGTATILVTDNGPTYDEEVTVTAKDGTEIGTGKLYIHNPLAVIGYAGTISSVTAKENAYVNAWSGLFSLKNTSFSANYDSLLRERADLEEELMDLLTIYRDGALMAPMDGIISSVEFDEDTTTYITGSSTNVLTLYPNISMSITIGIDETDILALEEDQEAEVEVSSVSEELFTGIVTEISKVADTSTGVTQYSAEVTLDKVDGMLAGMTADVNVKIEGVENAMIIPVDALHQTSTIYFVYTTYDEEQQQYGGMTEVTIGMQNDNYVEILSGLEVGDTVYYTEAEERFNMFGMMGGMSGMSNMGGNNMGGANSRPSGGQMGGGQMPGDQRRGG